MTTYDDGQPTEAENAAIMAEFTYKGSCGCDGYYDDGCPACSPAKRKAWLEEYRKPPPSLIKDRTT
jgi:hypothetical protein